MEGVGVGLRVDVVKMKLVLFLCGWFEGRGTKGMLRVSGEQAAEQQCE